MKEVYRIRKGTLSNSSYEIPFDFGLIFEEDGFFFFDFYVLEEFALGKLIETEEDIIFYQEFSMSAITEDGNKVEANSLSFTNVIPSQLKIKMKCDGYLSHIEVRLDGEGNEQPYNGKEDPTLFYLEVEGLRMKFSDFTEIRQTRNGIEIKDFNKWKRDYTNTTLVYKKIEFKLKFYESDVSENIILAFSNYRDANPTIMSYKVYQEFKRDLTSFISLLNGAEVQVRKEYIGGYYNDRIGSQHVITYSFKSINSNRHNYHIPLNHPSARGKNILNIALQNCFDNYVIRNRELDFNSIIFFLNGAQNSLRIEESFFVLIIAFERLSKKYVDTISDDDLLIIPEQTFNKIKVELLLVLRKYSNEIGNEMNKLAGKMGELHKIKRTGTEYKFLKLLEYAKIDVNWIIPLT